MMRQKVRIANGGAAWVASGEAEFTTDDLSTSLGQHASDQRLVHRVEFPADKRPPTVPAIATAWVSGWRVKGQPQWRITTSNVERDGFTVNVGKEGGSAIAYLAISWLAIGSVETEEAA